MSGDLGRLVLQFAADVAGFQSDLGRVERAAEKSAKETAKAFDRAVAGLTGSIKAAALQMGAALAAAFTVDALKDFVKAGIDVADKINEVAKKTGITTEALSGLKFAAEQSGLSFDSLTGALVKLEANSVKAANGNGKLQAAFGALGVSVADASGKVKSGNVLFTELAGAFSKLEDGPTKNAIGIDIFGKSFAKLVPLLNEGPEGLAKFNEQAERFGLIVDAETGKLADDFGDSLTAIKQAAEGAGISLAKQLLPTLIEATTRISDLIVTAKDSGELARFGELLKVLTDTVIGVSYVLEIGVGYLEEYFAAISKYTGITFVTGLLNDLAEAINGVTAAQAKATGFGDIKNGGRGTVGRPQPIGGIQNGATGNAKPELDGAAKAAEAYAKALAGLRNAHAAASPKVKEFVEAVRVLSIDKAILTTPKDLAAAIQKIREQLDPTIALTREYDQAVADLNKQSLIDINLKERNDELLKQLEAQYRKNITAVKDTATSYDSVTASLALEIEALKGSALSRDEVARTLRIEEEFLKRLAQAKANDKDLTEEQTKAIHKQVEELDDLQNYKQFDLATAIADSINEGFSKASLGAGFKAFFDKVKGAFKGSSEQVAGSITSFASTLTDIIQIARDSDGNAAGNIARSVANQLAGTNPYIAAAVAIDKLTGGRIFGTSFSVKDSAVNVGIGAGGASGSRTVNEERFKVNYFAPLFGGAPSRRITRSTTTALEADALKQFDDLFKSIQEAMANGARELSANIATIVSGEFKQTFDKDGKLTAQYGTILGRQINADIQAFAEALFAENLIAQIAESSSEAQAIAERWRGTTAASVQALADGAELLYSAQLDFVKGNGLLDGPNALTRVVDLIEELGGPGESLAETYQRVASATNLLGDALDVIGATTDLAREGFVRFSDDLVTALGGISEASAIIGRNIAEFFTPDELRATRLSGARTTLAGLGESTGLGLLSDIDFKALLSQALAGAFDAERTAEILAYGDALATVNGLVRETTAANEAAAQAETDRNRAIKEAAAALIVAQTALGDFVTGLQDQAADGSLTEYQRTLKALNKQYEANAESLLDLARQAGLTAAPIEGVTANLSILAQGAARALSDLKINVLKGLDSLFGGENVDRFASFNELVYGNARATNNWAEQLKDLEKLQSTQDLARNISDLFKASGLTFAQGVAEYGLPLRDLLDNLGVDFANLTSPESIAAFGAAAGFLGVSAQELAKLTGIDLSGLSTEQLTALDAASKPQVKAAESSANSLLSIDEKSTSIITVLMQQRTTAQEQNESLVRLGDKINSLAEEMRRIANRAPAA